MTTTASECWWYVGGPVIFALSTEMAARWFDMGRKVYPGTFAEAEVVWERGIVAAGAGGSK